MTTLTSTPMIQPTAPHRSDKFLAVLASLGRLLATGSGQRQMLADVLKELDRELGMIRGTLMLVSLDGSELFIEAAPDIPSPGQPGLRYRRGEGIIGRLCRPASRPIIPRVSRNHVHQPHPPNGDGRRRRGELPLRADRLGSEVVGTLSVDLPGAGARRPAEKRRSSWRSSPA